jgi:acetyltransferase-like isoleucine patch superfamily enzyme
MEYHKQDSSTPPVEWTTLLKVAEEVTINSKTYFRIKRWNYNPPISNTDYAEIFVRSTEDKLYAFFGREVLVMQIAPVGTTWYFKEGECSPGLFDYQVVKISSNEGITVPYGTFDVAYGAENYGIRNCVPPFPYITPFWYNYFVPGIGLAKEVDYLLDFDKYPFLTAPTIQELVRFIDKCVFIGQNPVIGTGTTIKRGVEVGDNCEIADGVTLNRDVTAGNNFKVGSNTIINQDVTICDDVELGDDVIIDKNVVIGSNVSIGNATVIGKNSTIGDTYCGTSSNITIGQGVVIGQQVTVGINSEVCPLEVIPASANVSGVVGNCP